MGQGYRDLVVRQKAKQFCINVCQLTNSLPESEKFGLCSQLRRAAVSIPSNIAEGSKRNIRRDQRQFYAVAHGSGAEIETQLEISKELFPALKAQIEKLEQDLSEIMKMLNRLRNLN